MNYGNNRLPSANKYNGYTKPSTGTRPQVSSNTAKATQPSNMARPASNVGPSKYTEAYPTISVSFQPDIRTLQTMTSNNIPPSDQNHTNKNFESFIKIETSAARNFFIVGFLLVQEVLVQESANPQKQEVRDYLINSFSSLMSQSRLNSQKNSFINFQAKLNDFLHYAVTRNRGDLFNHNDLVTVGKYISDMCKTDKELAYIIAQAGRGSIVKYMVQRHLESSSYAIFSKFTSDRGWDADDQYSTEIFELFSRQWIFKVVTYTAKGGPVRENTIGMDTAAYQAYILDYSSGAKEFKAILYPRIMRTEPEIRNGDQNTILTRNKQRGESMIAESDNSGSTRASDAKNVKQCNVCNQEILRNLVFNNPTCGHSFCQYCIEESGQISSGLCILRTCNGKMDKNKVTEFFTKCIQEEKSKPISLNHVPEEGSINKQPENITTFATSRSNKPYDDNSRMDESMSRSVHKMTCSVCQQRITEDNPAFVNEKCNHAVCMNCIAKNRPVFDRECFMKDCGQPMKFNSYSDFVHKVAGLSDFDVLCSKCTAEFSSNKAYVNVKCGHILCSKCTSKLTSTWCPASRCHEHLDEDEVMAFNNHMIKEVDRIGLLKKVITCPSCRNPIEIYSRDNTKSEYIKCTSCEGLFCPEHNDSMAKCLCLCPKCLGTLNSEAQINAKYCPRCSVSYCMRCRKESRGRQACTCMDEEHKKDEEVSGLKGVFYPERFTNVCGVCRDFREVPEFLRLDCGHQICEYCIITSKDSMRNKVVTCSACIK